MSFRNIQGSSLQNNDTFKINPLPVVTLINNAWVRNPSWLPLAAITSSDQKFTGLYQINRYANFIALTFNTSGGAQYTVDWGDGSAPVNVNSGTPAYYEYDWTDVDLDGTDAPVTFQDSGDTVTRNNHGYLDGMNISFATITTTTGISVNQTYYVVNATTNTFQVANTVGGSPIALTTDGSGTILPYKQVVVTVTPVSGNLTVANLNVKHNQSGLVNNYNTGWLDVAFAGSYTTLTCIGVANNVVNIGIQQFSVLNSALTSYAGLCSGLGSLYNVSSIASTATVTSAAQMFINCFNLQTVPLFTTTNVTTMDRMFSNCRNLKTVPLYDTTNVTMMGSMFLNCFLLTSVPLFNTANVTTFGDSNGGMFQSCRSLQAIPMFNTIKATSMQSMFSGCRNLETIPLFNTANTTNMSSLFNGCNVLKSIPLFDTSKVTDMSGMFGATYQLKSIPLFNTSNVTNMGGMFSGSSLESLPLLNTSNVTSMASMFRSTNGIIDFVGFDVSNVVSMNEMFNNCTTIQNIVMSSSPKLTDATLIFQNCSQLEYVNMGNTCNLTSFVNMANGCGSLNTVILGNTINLLNCATMFNGCSSLINLQIHDTSKVSNMRTMFQNCNSLVALPYMNTINVTDMGTMFFGCGSLQFIPEMNTSNVANLNSIFSSSQLSVYPLTNLKRMTTAFSPTPSSSKYLISKAIVSFSVANSKLSGVALDEIYSNLSPVAGSCTFQGTADTVTINSHGYSEGDTIRFATIVTTTGISINTTYTVRNPTTNTFQLSLTDTSAIINLVNDGTGTRAAATITVTGNYGTTSDDPTIATGKGWTVTGS